jgi:hypothetical protein
MKKFSIHGNKNIHIHPAITPGVISAWRYRRENTVLLKLNMGDVENKRKEMTRKSNNVSSDKIH